MYPVSNAALFQLLRPEPIAQRQHLFRRHFFDIFSLFSTPFVQFHSFYDIANVHVIILCLYAPHRSYFYGIPSGIDGVMVLPIFYLIWICQCILSFYVGEVWLKESAKRLFLHVPMSLFCLECPPAVRYQHPAWLMATSWSDFVYFTSYMFRTYFQLNFLLLSLPILMSLIVCFLVLGRFGILEGYLLGRWTNDSY